MARVPRRGKAAKRRHVGAKERRQAQGETQELTDQGTIALVVQVIGQTLLDEVTRLLGRERSQRRDLADRTRVKARCNREEIVSLDMRTRVALLGFLVIAAFFLVTEHTAHGLGVLPFALLLLCPLLHLFMHGGGHSGGHGSHADGERQNSKGGDR